MRIFRRTLRYVSKIAGCFLLILPLFFAEEAARGWWELREIRTRLNKAGIELNPARLAEIRTINTVAADRLLEAGQKIKELHRSAERTLDYPASMKMMAPGEALVCFQQAAPPQKEYRSAYKTGAKTWEEAEKWLAESRPYLEQIRTALGEPVAFAMDYRNVTMARPPDFSFLQAAIPDLMLDVLIQLRSGHLPEASANLVALHRLSRAMEATRSSIGVTMGVAFFHFSNPLIWEALQAEGWTEPGLRALQEELEAADTIKAVQESLEIERAGVSQLFEMLRGSHASRAVLMRMEKMNFARVLADDDYEPPEPNEWEIWLRSRLWQLVWSQMDEATALRKLTHRVEELQALQKSRNWKKCPLRNTPKDVRLDPLGRYRMLVSSTVASRAIAAGMANTAVKMEAQRGLFVAAIALRRCKIARGHLPERLVDLVPEFLEEEPVDFMNGSSLHYRRNEDDTFQLYSVGEDGMDDGGDPSSGDAKRKGIPGMEHGKDMVFPAIFRG